MTHITDNDEAPVDVERLAEAVRQKILDNAEAVALHLWDTPLTLECCGFDMDGLPIVYLHVAL